MDEGGFIFTIDAALMLIPLFIIVATVSGLNLSVPHESPYYQSQDVMETLYNIYGPNTVSLGTLANNITGGNASGAVTQAQNTQFKEIMDKSGRHYQLIYFDSSGNPVTLVNNGNMSTSPNVASSTRTYNNVTFRLYMW